MSDPAPPGRRTSARVLLVHTITFRQARALAPLVLGLGAARGLGDGVWTIVALVVGITVLSAVAAAVSWWRFGYAVGERAVVVTRGLLTRSVRTVPLDRVRGVEVEAPLLHRLLGLVRVRIDAAAGSSVTGAEELLVDGVPRAEGDRLRTALLTRRPRPVASGPDGAVRPAEAPDGPVEPVEPVEPIEEEIARFDNRWLLYAPLVGGYLAAPLAAVGALGRLVDELPARFVPDVEGPDVVDGSVIALAVVAAVLVLVLGSVIGAAVVNWRFRLVRRGGSLIAVRGLVTRRHTELEIDRIRGYTVSEGLGMRLVGAARASALVTGLGDAARRGQLLPLGPRAEAWSLGARIVEAPGPLRAHPPAARRRAVVRSVASGGVVLLAGAVLTATLGWWWVLATGAALALLGVPLGLGRYAALGHAAGPRSLAVRSGYLLRTHTVLQRRAVIGWQVRQSPFQRRSGLATVLACVGAGSGGYEAVDLAADEAAEFAAAASGPWAGTLRQRVGSRRGAACSASPSGTQDTSVSRAPGPG